MITVVLDVDETVADLHEPWLEWYNDRYGKRMFLGDMIRWDWDTLVPEGKAIYRFLTPDIYDSNAVLPIIGAQSSVDLLRQTFNIVFASSCYDEATAHAKQRWLVRYGFLRTAADLFIPVFPGQSKANVPGTILVDDHIKHVSDFHYLSRTSRPAILISRPWNRSYEWPMRVNTITAAANLIRTLYLDIDQPSQPAILDPRQLQLALGGQAMYGI